MRWLVWGMVLVLRLTLRLVLGLVIRLILGRRARLALMLLRWATRF